MLFVLESAIPISDVEEIEEMMRRGEGRPAPETVARLYREAFERSGVRPLWSRRPSATPTIAQALVVARPLRRDGDMRTRPLAIRIEDACRAAV